MAVYRSSKRGRKMDKMEIRSLYGTYNVFFSEQVPYKEVIRTDDIIIADKKVLQSHKEILEGIVDPERVIEIEASEEQKSYQGIAPIMEKVISQGFRKNNALIAIGGGITQDITAFMSSILYRGVSWKFIPTTLLAQCDSCIGSKTSINFLSYKNQLGGFYPPKEIYISPVFLESLEEREIKSGLGEMLHYYVVGGEADFAFFEANHQLAKKDSLIMQELIRKSLEIKRQYIEIDEFDRKERQIFNYGHSFGHALESVTAYAIPHGIAVSIGMDIANHIAEKRGLLDGGTKSRIRNVAKIFWETESIKGIDMSKYIGALKKDKKNEGNKLGVILCSGFGNLAKHFIDADDGLRELLQAWGEENGIEWV